jgi:hypothetical protein
MPNNEDIQRYLANRQKRSTAQHYILSWRKPKSNPDAEVYKKLAAMKRNTPRAGKRNYWAQT